MALILISIPSLKSEVLFLKKLLFRGPLKTMDYTSDLAFLNYIKFKKSKLFAYYFETNRELGLLDFFKYL